MGKFFSAIMENLVFFTEFLGIVVAVFVLAYVLERWSNKRTGYSGKIITTKKIAMVGVFAAVSTIAMMFEVPMPFAPNFYKIDLSEVPVMIVTFAFGPVTGVLTEFCKILLKVIFKSTSTAFVGELANFAVGCSLLISSSVVYLMRKNRNHALIGMVVGTLCMTIFGSAFNAIYLLPKFAQLYGMPLDNLVQMGTAINPSIHSVTTMVLFSVAPLNLVKGVAVSAVTLLLYKKLSVIIKADYVDIKKNRKATIA